MVAQITPFLEKVTLLGGGDLTAETVSQLLTRAPNLAVCDGAASQALAFGHIPSLVIGDMDSIDPKVRAALDPDTFLEITEQDTTDFDKALRSIKAPMILGAGFMGGRLDHELACYNALVRNPDKRCILVGDGGICFHSPGTLRLDLAAGDRVSLFPMREVVVSMSGLEWSHKRLTLAPDGRVGTSNMATGPVLVEPEGRGLLVILPPHLLDAAIEGLSQVA